MSDRGAGPRASRRLPSRLAGIGMAAIALAFLALFRPSHHGTAAHTGPSPAPRLALVTAAGRPFILADLGGRAALVYFGYTRCPDVCPMTLAALPAALDRLGPDRARVSVLFVTLDPLHDTPAALAAWLQPFRLPAIALTGSPAEIRATAAAWGIAFRPASNPAFLDHASILTLVAPDGTRRARYNLSELDPDRIARDLRAVLAPS